LAINSYQKNTFIVTGINVAQEHTVINEKQIKVIAMTDSQGK